jgi:hypothetical protein
MSINQALYQEDIFTVTEVREGDMEGNDYANIKILEDEPEISEGYIGVKVGKLKCESRALAKKIIKELTAVGVPVKVHFKVGLSVGSKEAMKVVVKDFILAKSSSEVKL